jgi:hypothetical protein
MPPVLVISIPSPPGRHDEMLRTRVAPVIRRLQPADAVGVVWFERANKPDWALHVLASGDDAWLEHDARTVMANGLGVTTGEARYIDGSLDDKWTGGLRFAEQLGGFHRIDTLACLDALEADAQAELGSRAQFNLRVIEGLLDALDVHDDRRLSFYRRSFEWAVELGRWDREVLDSLERTFTNQRDALAAMIDGQDGAPGRWPSARAARIGSDLLARIGAWASSAAAPDEVAVHAAHSHSNRLGVHGGRETALRYLMWRARGGRPLEPA